jgi:hypothetical protein
MTDIEEDLILILAFVTSEINSTDTKVQSIPERVYLSVQ